MSYLWHDALMYVSHVIFMKESRTLASFVTWISHVTYISASCHKYIRTLERHVIFMKESCHIHPWVMSQIWMRYFTYINASFHQNEWVMSRDTRTGLLYGMTQYVRHMTRHMTHSMLCESSQIHELRHVPFNIESCRTTYEWHDSFNIESWCSIESHDMTHPYIWHDAFSMLHTILRHSHKTLVRHDSCTAWLHITCNTESQYHT